jgi:hypothetical protein
VRGWSRLRYTYTTGTALGSHCGGEMGTKWCRHPSSPRGNLGGGVTLVSGGSGVGNGSLAVTRAAQEYGGDP